MDLRFLTHEATAGFFRIFHTVLLHGKKKSISFSGEEGLEKSEAPRKGRP